MVRQLEVEVAAVGGVDEAPALARAGGARDRHVGDSVDEHDVALPAEHDVEPLRGRR
jgi:hypothetical protein